MFRQNVSSVLKMRREGKGRAAAILTAALALAAAAPLRAQVDPLRQVGATTAKPNVLLVLDASSSMSSPMDSDKEHGRQYVDNFGGWRFIREATSSPYGAAGAELCIGAGDDEVCAEYAWYEPSRFSTMKNVLGETITINTLRDKDYCAFSPSSPASPYSCAERTNWSSGTSFTTTYETKYLNETGGVGGPGAKADYPTLVCVSDPHDVGHGAPTSLISGDPDSGLSLVQKDSVFDDGTKWTYTNDFFRGLGVWSLWHIDDLCAPAGAGGSSKAFRYGVNGNCASFDTGGIRNGGWLISPKAATVYDQTFLSFWSRRDTEMWNQTCDMFYDRGAVYVRSGAPTGLALSATPFSFFSAPPTVFNGWRLVGEICDEDNGLPTWRFYDRDISAEIAALSSKADIYVGFVFDTMDGIINNYYGWGLDNVSLISYPAAISSQSETALQATSPLTVASGAAAKSTELVPATTLTGVDLATVSFSLSGSNNAKTCTQVSLLAPDGSAYVLKAFGAAAAASYDVTATYNAEGAGTYSLELATEANSGSCKSSSWNLTLGTLVVEITGSSVGSGGGAVTVQTHALWNGNPCSFFSTTPQQAISPSISTSQAQDNLGGIRSEPRRIVAGVGMSMNLGLVIYGSNADSKAVNASDYYHSSGNEGNNVIVELARLNPQDEDLAGQQFVVDSINAYFRPVGVKTEVLNPATGSTVDIYGLSTTDQPTFPFNKQMTTTIDAIFDRDDDNSPCRKSYVIYLVDSNFTSSSSGCAGQEQLTKDSMQDLVDTGTKIFVIQFGPGGRRFMANQLAYIGRTDASDPDGLAGLDYVEGDGSDLDLAFADSHDTTCDECSDACTAGGQHNFAYFAENQDELADAFNAIFAAIAAGDYVTAPPSVAPAASSTSATFNFMGLLSSAEFPGWKGHLRAADLRKVRENADGSGSCVDITTLNQENPLCDFWDAGQKLTDRNLSADPREIWTFNPSTMAMFKLTTANEASLRAMNPSFIAGATKCVAGMVNATEFIRFINGYDHTGTVQRPWILGDSVNVTPVLVDRPIAYGLQVSGTRVVQDDKDDFDLTYKNRHGVIYLPANDGMLHAFDSIDGYELFAFLPPSQLNNVLQMFCNFREAYLEALDEGGSIADVENPTGQIPYAEGHLYNLTASPRVADITVEQDVDGDPATLDPFEWRTYLFMGEGGGGDTYYALDVTHPYKGRTGLCDYFKDPTCATLYDYTADPNYDSVGGKPFEVKWFLDNSKTGFGGIDESWGIVPVGLLNDPGFDSGTSTSRRHAWALAFGSYHGIEWENSRRADAAENSFWVVRADTGALLKRFDPSDAVSSPATAHVADFSDPLPYAVADPSKPNIPNGTFADTVVMSTEYGLDRHYPDAPVTRVFQADLQGRIWLADIKTNGDDDGDDNWEVADWVQDWDHYAKMNLIDSSLLTVTYGTSTGQPVGAQPIHYTPAVAHLSPFRYVIAFSSGGWLETNINVASASFPAHIILAILDKTLDDNICQTWVARLTELQLIDDNGQVLLNDDGTERRLTGLARVTGPPLMIIRKPGENETLPTRGTVLYTVYDSGTVDSSTGYCVGTSYAVLLDFEHQIGDPEEPCDTGSASAQIIQIGIGFITMTAGPTSPILALSGIGKGSQASLGLFTGETHAQPLSDMTVLSWQEMDCRY
jgi:hypothetical protein